MLNLNRIFVDAISALPSGYELQSRAESLDEILRDAASDDVIALGIPPHDPLHQYHFSVAPGTKVRGHVRWVQEPQVPICACGAAMSHLLTIAAAEFDGAYQRWIRGMNATCGNRASLRETLCSAQPVCRLATWETSTCSNATLASTDQSRA